METYYKGESESMPYNTNSTLKVREFRGSSRSNILSSWNIYSFRSNDLFNM